MLFITRKDGQEVVIVTDIGDRINIKIRSSRKNEVKLGISTSVRAGKFTIHRKEVQDKIDEAKRTKPPTDEETISRMFE